MKQNINKISILKHSNNIRVYYEDTDAGGLVYHANYLKFAERSRTEMLRKVKIEQLILKNDYNIQFIVKNLFIEFFRPAQLDDLLTIIFRPSKFIFYFCIKFLILTNICIKFL